MCLPLVIKGSFFLRLSLVVSGADVTVCITITQENRTSWQRWVYICLPSLDCSSRSISEYLLAQKRPIPKTRDDHVISCYNPDRDFIPLYPTRIWVAKVTYRICHIISSILLLCGECHVYPVHMFAEVHDRSSPH